MLFGGGGTKEEAKKQAEVDPALMVDDAIEIEDDAIIVEPANPRKNSNNIDSLIVEKKLTETDQAILNAA